MRANYRYNRDRKLPIQINHRTSYAVNIQNKYFAFVSLLLVFLGCGKREQTSTNQITVQPGEQIQIFKGHTLRIHSVDISSDDKYLASGSSDGTVRIWEVATGNMLECLEGHTDAVLGVSFFGDSRFVASGGYDDTGRAWDLKNGELITTFTKHSSDIYCATAASSGPWVATGGRDDQFVHIWNGETGESVYEERQAYYVRYMCFSDDSRYLAICSNYWGARDRAEVTGVVRVIAVPDGTEIMSASVRGSRMSFNHDGTLLAFADRVLDVSTGEVKFQLNETDANIHCISPNGKYVAGLLDDNRNQIVIWDCTTSERVGLLSGHTGPVTNLRYSRDGDLLASSSYDGTVRLWNVAFTETGE